MLAEQVEKPDANRVKEFAIVINGRQVTVTGRVISYSELIDLAFENPPTGENVCFTITFRRGQGNKPSGTLGEGDSVKLKKGMIFDVTPTDKS